MMRSVMLAGKLHCVSINRLTWDRSVRNAWYDWTTANCVVVVVVIVVIVVVLSLFAEI